MISFYSHPFWIMTAAASVSGYCFARYEWKRNELNLRQLHILALPTIFFSYLGSRMLFEIMEYGAVRNVFRYSGLMLQGWIAGVVFSLILFSRFYKISFWRIADVLTPAILAGQIVGKIGCFIAGCCVGIPTHANWGVPAAGNGSELLHPAQLYEAGTNLIIFTFIWQARKKIQRKGILFLLYLMLYSITRIPLQHWRANRTFPWNLSWDAAQVIAFSVLCAALGTLLYRYKGHPQGMPIRDKITI